jgi:hypothetical protein
VIKTAELASEPQSKYAKAAKVALDGSCRCVALASGLLRRAVLERSPSLLATGRKANDALPVCRGQRVPMQGMLSPAMMLIKPAMLSYQSRNGRAPRKTIVPVRVARAIVAHRAVRAILFAL